MWQSTAQCWHSAWPTEKVLVRILSDEQWQEQCFENCRAILGSTSNGLVASHPPCKLQMICPPSPEVETETYRLRNAPPVTQWQGAPSWRSLTFFFPELWGLPVWAIHIRDLPEHRFGERWCKTDQKELTRAYTQAWPYTRCYLTESSQILYVLGFTLLVCHTQNPLTPSLYPLLQVLKADQEMRFVDKGCRPKIQIGMYLLPSPAFGVREEASSVSIWQRAKISLWDMGNEDILRCLQEIFCK